MFTKIKDLNSNHHPTIGPNKHKFFISSFSIFIFLLTNETPCANTIIRFFHFASPERKFSSFFVVVLFDNCFYKSNSYSTVEFSSIQSQVFVSWKKKYKNLKNKSEFCLISVLKELFLLFGFSIVWEIY